MSDIDTMFGTGERTPENIKKTFEDIIKKCSGTPKTLPIPEAMAVFKLNFNSLSELEKYIKENKEILGNVWKKYREALKVKFSEVDKDFLKGLIGTYQLGADNTEVPPINFVIKSNPQLEQFNKMMEEQTKIQKEIMRREIGDVSSVEEDDIEEELDALLGD